MHTVSQSPAADRAVDRTVDRTHRLDRIWLWTNLLNEVAKLGSFRGLGLDFDRRGLYGDSYYDDQRLDSPEEPLAFLKMQLWGNQASEVLRVLRGSGAFPNETSLAKVKIKHWLDGDASDSFSVDDLKFNGKFTTRGTSFQSHISLVTEVIGRYSSALEFVESTFRVGMSTVSEGLIPRGRPATFVFSNQLPDVERVAVSISRGAPPFRVWGVPTPLGKNAFRIRGVDMHVGHRVDIEIYSDAMRVFVPENGCGNTILRLLTNLQHHVDAMVSLETGEGAIGSAFQPAHDESVDRPL